MWMSTNSCHWWGFQAKTTWLNDVSTGQAACNPKNSETRLKDVTGCFRQRSEIRTWIPMIPMVTVKSRAHDQAQTLRLGPGDNAERSCPTGCCRSLPTRICRTSHFEMFLCNLLRLSMFSRIIFKYRIKKKKCTHTGPNKMVNFQFSSSLFVRRPHRRPRPKASDSEGSVSMLRSDSKRLSKSPTSRYLASRAWSTHGLVGQKPNLRDSKKPSPSCLPFCLFVAVF